MAGLLAVTTNKDTGDSVILWRSLLRKIVRSGDQAAALSQLCYWYGTGKDGKRRLRLFRGGKLWVAKTYVEFGVELGIRENQIRHVMDWLCRHGFVERKLFGFNGAPTCHFRIIAKAVQVAILKMVEKEASQ